MSRTSGTNYIRFGRQELIVAFAKDRGELKSNDYGDYFFRELADGKRFTCCSEDLERKLIDAGYRAGQQVGITRETYGNAVTWRVRLVAPVAEIPRPHEPTRRPAAATHHPIPESKYASPEPSALVFPELDERPAQASQQARDGQPYAPAESLICRALVEAIDAAKAGQQHAATIGFPLTFSSSDIQDLASTIFIQRCRD